MAKTFQEDFEEDQELDIGNLKMSLEPGTTWQETFEEIFNGPYVTDEFTVGALYVRRRLANHYLPILIKDMEEAPRSLSEDAGFEKAIDFIRKLQEEMEKGIDY